jgi:hypothetical protein
MSKFLLLSYDDGSSLVPNIFYYLRNLMREIHEKPALNCLCLEEFIVEMGKCIGKPKLLGQAP